MSIRGVGQIGGLPGSDAGSGLCMFTCSSILSAMGMVAAFYEYDLDQQAAASAVEGITVLCLTNCQLRQKSFSNRQTSGKNNQESSQQSNNRNQERNDLQEEGDFPWDNYNNGENNDNYYVDLERYKRTEDAKDFNSDVAKFLTYKLIRKMG